MIQNLHGTSKLELDYSLPIIGIPDNKVISFVKWFEEDLKNVHMKDIPLPFEEGYIAILGIPYEFKEGVKSEFIKRVAKLEKSTYRYVEETLSDIYDEMSSSIIVHFDFKNNRHNLHIYNGNTYEEIGNLPLDKDGVNLDNPLIFSPIEIDGNTIIINNADCILYEGQNRSGLFQNDMLAIYYALFMGSMWYLTLYKNRYKYEKVLDKDGVREVLFKKPYEKKNSNVKTITTSIYDLSRTPRTKVQTFIKKRAGFEYSHQFDVSGHYRHYKDGKVVYINQYTKCKDKPELGQKYVILDPRKGR